MANRSLLINTRSTTWLLRLFTWVLGVIFLAGNLVLLPLAMNFLPLLASLVLLPILFLVEIGLLLRYAGKTGQWRAVFLFWGVYSLARLTVVWVQSYSGETVTTLTLLLAVYAMLAGWLAMVILVIRRDVSLAYMVIPFIIGPILLRAQVLASGGVLAWLSSLMQQSDELPPFTLLEPAFMSIACMSALGIPTFIAHFLWLWVKEVRRDRL